MVSVHPQDDARAALKASGPPEGMLEITVLHAAHLPRMVFAECLCQYRNRRPALTSWRHLSGYLRELRRFRSFATRTEGVVVYQSRLHALRWLRCMAMIVNK